MMRRCRQWREARQFLEAGLLHLVQNHSAQFTTGRQALAAAVSGVPLAAAARFVAVRTAGGGASADGDAPPPEDAVCVPLGAITSLLGELHSMPLFQVSSTEAASSAFLRCGCCTLSGVHM